MAAPKESTVVEARFAYGAQSDASLPPPTLVEVAFAGRSNVGKSSLLNCMLSRKNLVRTSNTPGCTRQIAFYETTLADDSKLYLVDLPGFGYAKRSKTERSSWAQLIEGYLSTRVSLSAVVLLIDVRRGVQPEERELAEFIAHANAQRAKQVQLVWVATKLDKLPKSQQKPELEGLKRTLGHMLLGVSAVTGDGRDALWRRLRGLSSLEASGD
ncbi:MAG: ribosome biogenesis GTP-binding protein YihA/YsxC [Polyangiaceae bacterium]